MVSIRQAVAASLRPARSVSGTQGLVSRVPGTAGMLCLLTASIVVASHAYAQQAPASQETPASSEQPATLEEVTVTGSRIKRASDFTTATPTTVFDATELQNRGIVNIGDALNETPSNISSVTPSTTGNSSFNAGSYIPDLRGLNPFFGSRTLTLIDGQRAVSTNTLDSFDLNFIPQVLVQRLDTVTGGGSAIYGSGAVAGVVNVILDHQLEGGKFDADTYETHYNDGKTNHVSAAFGHGIFDNRIHFVIGAEYQKQDTVSCQNSGRTWCNSDRGAYDNNFTPGFATFTQAIGSGLTSNNSPNGVLSPASYNGYNAYALNVNAPLHSASADGLGLIPFQANNSFLNLDAAPGGSGEPANMYTNLVTPVKRGVISGSVTAKITDSINMTADVNWGKVTAYNPSDNFGNDSGVLGNDNPYLIAIGGAAAWGPGGSAYGGAPAAFFEKDFSQQINFGLTNETTLKQIALGLNGTIPGSSWSWDAHGRYGQTANLQTGQEFSVLASSMALDAVTGAGGATACRVTGGGLAGASASANVAYGGGGLSGLALPTYVQVYNAISAGGGNPTSPVSGLTELQTLQLFSQGCQPLNPFGDQPLAGSTANFAIHPLALQLEQTLSSFNVNATGEFWKGFGAGAFSAAVGYEWHREITNNQFATCSGAENTLGNANLTTAQRDCLANASDFAYQYGNDYGGATTMNEVYAEFSLPLLKDVPFAKTLSLDVSGRDTFYVNQANYGVAVVPGSQGTGSLPTWKAALVWEPIEGIRFRGSQSHDSRDPDPRDLYYSQTFVPGNPAFKGLFDAGYCFDGAGTQSVAESLCTTDLLGNVKLKPETSNTTDLGFVFTPPQLPGFQGSIDWFHVRLTNGIEGAGLNGRTNCYSAIQTGGVGAAASNQFCQGLTFNTLSYNAAGQVVAAGTAGAVTGVNAFALGNVANIVEEDTQAYNGGSFDERGVDFSLAYSVALPGSAGTLSARALTTWVGEQTVVDQPGSPSISVLGETGANALFLPNYQPAARWRGNMSITWNVANFSLTPNISWVGQGIKGTNDISCTTADFTTAGNPCQFASVGLNGPASTATAAQKAYYNAAANVAALTILPAGQTNHVPFYFLVGLNAAYNITAVPGLKGLTLWGQVNNLLNKAPPFLGNTTSNPVFYDQLGQAYRIGFRMTF